jgi:hypothetical protein
MHNLQDLEPEFVGGFLKSTVVRRVTGRRLQGQGDPLQTMAAYIDLNPVRAGVVEDPKDYRFCGYAEAVAGVVEAKKGLICIWSDHGASWGDLAMIQSLRRQVFY